MSEIVALVEGQTEQDFVHDLLAGHLGSRGITMWAVLSGRGRHQGGVKRWLSARGDILRILKSGRYCTTMFDFYALPRDWPGRTDAARLAWQERAASVERELHRDISAAVGSSFNPAQFIPYVQLHEFESLLFADTAKLAQVAASTGDRPVQGLQRDLETILCEAGSPEGIDDGYETCPSRRITRLIPGFRKRLHGLMVAQSIGLAALATACPHFGRWVCTLEGIGGTATGLAVD